MRLQSVIRAIYPTTCVACDVTVTDENGLCAACWSDTRFLGDVVCHACGVPLPGVNDGTEIHCDDCLTAPRPWDAGRSVFAYEGAGRRLVLGIKHGDRTDLVPIVARWMARRAEAMVHPGTLIVPIPLHWSRLLGRRYNQAALLAQGIGKVLGHEVCVDALVRQRRTALLNGHSRDGRFSALAGAIIAHPRRIPVLSGRAVLLVDDVMTSGATLSAATEALCAANVANVSTLTLARVVKDP